MRVLGIHDGHTSTACLLEDGAIVAMASEERFSRVKSCGGIPYRAIEWVLNHGGRSPVGEIDRVAVVGLAEPLGQDDQDLQTLRHTYFSKAAEYLPERILGSPRLVQSYLALRGRKRAHLTQLARLLEKFSISEEKFHLVEHHEAHAAAAYYTSWYRNDTEPILIITLDGSGDGICGSVSIGSGIEMERRLAIPAYHSLGEMYTRVTQFLGMKPLEHEYKVMGLAPYAPEKLAERAHAVFGGYIRLSEDGRGFVNTSKGWGESFLKRLQRDLMMVRFDAVAAGIQRRMEELVVQYILNWVRFTDIHNVAVGGGCFMNVKVNMLLAQLKEVEKIFFFPSCGDESIALGGALRVYAALCKEKGQTPRFSPLQSLYYGPEYSDEEIEEVLREYRERVSYERVSNVEEVTAKLLTQNKIVGRLWGRMEWGARALGNRSILSDPRNLTNLRRLNAAIKMRDYWMPFAPSILWERRHDYLVNPKDLPAPYMILAFESTELARKELVAALHPSDLTCRPQLVQEAWNGPYYRLLKHFEQLTGCGALLNTSFNLHGDPVVCSPRDAIETLLHSGLDYVTIGSYLVSRR